MLKLKMLQAYSKVAATNHYIIGGVCGDYIKADFKELEDLTDNLSLTAGSNRERNSTILRLAFSKNLKKAIDEDGFIIGTLQEFEKLAIECGGKGRKNRGIAFEKMVFNYFGQEHSHDNIEFTKQGDININGIEYQIKTHKGTFSNLSKLQELTGLEL